MQKIKISCTSGTSVKLNDLLVYSGKLKKHSQLEIERLCESIVNDGFLFPIAVAKLENKTYVVDGECRLFALQELEYRGFEIPEVPVFYIRCKDEKTLIKLILYGTSTNHCVTEASLKAFNKEDFVDLKKLAFAESDLIDFHSDVDVGLYIHVIGGKFSEQKLNKEDFEGLLK